MSIASLLLSIGSVWYQQKKENETLKYDPTHLLLEDIRKQLDTPFQPTIPLIPGIDHVKKEGSEVLEKLCHYNCLPNLSYIEGPSNCGKTIAIEAQIRGRRNVVNISLRNQSPRHGLASALGLSESVMNENSFSVPDMMMALKQVLTERKLAHQQGNSVSIMPLIILSDFIVGNEECKVIAGCMLQFVEEELASGIHVSANRKILIDLKKLSGHSRLSKYSISYANPLDLERYAICRNEHVKKLGGHLGQIHSFINSTIPLIKKQGVTLLNDEIIKELVNGQTILPEESIKELIDSIIKGEANEMKVIINEMKQYDSSVKVLNTLFKTENHMFFPKTLEEFQVCEQLTEKNLLSDVSDYYTWNRPVLRFAFGSIMQSYSSMNRHD